MHLCKYNHPVLKNKDIKHYFFLEIFVVCKTTHRYFFISIFHMVKKRLGGVMGSVLASSAVDCGFKPRSGQTKDYKIGVFCFSAKHAALTRKNKDWLARNQDNVSEWGNMSNRELLFQ